MNILLARHYGMCFGVRDALRATHSAAQNAPLTILGELVHNPLVERYLNGVGAQRGELGDLNSATTHQVAITAHGASNADRLAWAESGHLVIDTTCPLVRKAHDALALLASEGYLPVVIGQPHHVEVRGLIGDYPNAVVVMDAKDVALIPVHRRLGVVSQTTLPVEFALRLVEEIKRQHPSSLVRFIDTVCHPTKQRQSAMDDLLARLSQLTRRVLLGG